MLATYAQTLNKLPWGFWAVLSFLFGAMIASFLGVVGERVPRGETLGGRSHCICGAELAAWANLPIVGWIACRGQARCCGAQIPVRYVIGEACLALTWGVVGALAPSYWAAAIGFVVSALALLAASWRRPEQQ